MCCLSGREVALSGKEMKWEKLLASNERLDPMLNLSQFDIK